MFFIFVIGLISFYSTEFVFAVPADCTPHNLYFSQDNVNFYPYYFFYQPNVNERGIQLFRDWFNSIRGKKIVYGSGESDFFEIDAFVLYPEKNCYYYSFELIDANRFVLCPRGGESNSSLLDSAILSVFFFLDMENLIKGYFRNKISLSQSDVPFCIRLKDPKQDSDGCSYCFLNLFDGNIYADHALINRYVFGDTTFSCGPIFFEQRKINLEIYYSQARLMREEYDARKQINDMMVDEFLNISSLKASEIKAANILEETLSGGGLELKPNELGLANPHRPVAPPQTGLSSLLLSGAVFGAVTGLNYMQRAVNLQNRSKNGATNLEKREG